MINGKNLIKIFKKQVRIKELENRDKAKRKTRNYFILNEYFIKKRRKLQQSTKQERFGKTMVEI